MADDLARALVQAAAQGSRDADTEAVRRNPMRRGASEEERAKKMLAAALRTLHGRGYELVQHDGADLVNTIEADELAARVEGLDGGGN